MLHVLWECGVAPDIWAGCPGLLQKGVRGQAYFMQLVEELLNKLSSEEQELFWVRSWIIWNQRNSTLHGGKLQDPTRLIK